jgi:hypothetical protein
MDDRLLVRRDRLRRRCQAGLNKGEGPHFLAHAVYMAFPAVALRPPVADLIMAAS